MPDVQVVNTDLSTSYIATLAGMDGSSARCRTGAIVAAVLTVLALALTPAALAQSAGDNQYADPLTNGDGQSRQQEQPDPDAGGGGDDSAVPAPPTAAPAAPATSPQAGTTATDHATLPRTGSDALLLAGAGLALTLTGALALGAARRPRSSRG
jgi:LPXTG-motif cell wall-anchored protein